MKKFTILIACFFALTFANAQTKGYEYYLSHVESTDEIESYDYHYLDNYLLDWSHSKTSSGTRRIDSLRYDADWNIIKVITYQLLNSEWRYTSYIDYTFDANGNMLTRKNYNSFENGPFELGGTYFYTYNTDNQMTYWELYMESGLVQTANLTYNEAGLVVEEIGTLYGENSWKINYEYNEDGYLTLKNEYEWNGYWSPYSISTYEYDELGNCVSVAYSQNGAIVEKHVFQYDLSILDENVALAVNPENKYDLTYLRRNNLINKELVYGSDGSQLLHVYDYLISYEEIVNDVPSIYGDSSNSVSLYPNPATNNFCVEGEGIEKVELFDITGRCVKSQIINEMTANINLSELEDAVYIVKVYQSDRVTTSRLLKVK